MNPVKVEGEYSFAVDRETLWARLLDPEVLAGCIPGCRELKRIGEDGYDVLLRVKVGPVTGNYSGTVVVSESDYPSSLKMTVEGRGRGGTVRGQGLLHLREQNGGTELAIEGEAHVSGLIARVGQRLVGGASRMMMGQFFGCIREKIEEGA